MTCPTKTDLLERAKRMARLAADEAVAAFAEGNFAGAESWKKARDRYIRLVERLESKSRA